MNTDYLTEFIAFSKKLNYAKTAKELYISQPTLIQHIAKLEEDLGVDLILHRGKARKPALTPAGSVLAYSAGKILDVCDKVAASCREAAEKEGSCIYVQDVRSSIGIPPAFFDTLKDSLGGIFSARFKTSLEYGESSLLEILDGEDRVDIAFGVFFKGAGIEELRESAGERYGFAVLPAEECLLLAAADHPLATHESVSVRDMAGYRLTFCEHRPWQPFFDAMEKDLRKYLPDLEVGFFPPNPTQDPLMISHENIRIYPATQGQTATSYWEGGIVALPLVDYDAHVVPVAVYRKDNPKKAVHDFFDRLSFE